MNGQLATHMHIPGAAPVASDAAMFSEKLATANKLSLQLGPLIQT